MSTVLTECHLTVPTKSSFLQNLPRLTTHHQSRRERCVYRSSSVQSSTVSPDAGHIWPEQRQNQLYTN